MNNCNKIKADENKKKKEPWESIKWKSRIEFEKNLQI